MPRTDHVALIGSSSTLLVNSPSIVLVSASSPASARAVCHGRLVLVHPLCEVWELAGLNKESKSQFTLRPLTTPWK